MKHIGMLAVILLVPFANGMEADKLEEGTGQAAAQASSFTAIEDEILDRVTAQADGALVAICDPEANHVRVKYYPEKAGGPAFVMARLVIRTDRLRLAHFALDGGVSAPIDIFEGDLPRPIWPDDVRFEVFIREKNGSLTKAATTVNLNPLNKVVHPVNLADDRGTIRIEGKFSEKPVVHVSGLGVIGRDSKYYAFGGGTAYVYVGGSPRHITWCHASECVTEQLPGVNMTSDVMPVSR